MKRALLLISTCFIFTLTKAQGYIPMLGDSNTWYITHCFEGCVSQIFETVGDTVLNGLHYKFEYGYNDSLKTYATLLAYIREDTGLQRIYLVRNLNNNFYNSTTQADSAANADSNEYILYDFSLLAGDSIFLPLAQNTYDTVNRYGTASVDTSAWYYVDSVSTVNTLAGSRKIIYLNQPNCLYECNVSWVEQIGALNGIYLAGGYSASYSYYEGTIGGFENTLNCTFMDTVYTYTAHGISQDSVNACFLIISGINNVADNSGINVYPNPVDKELSVSFNDPAYLFKGTLVDMMGKQLTGFTTSQTKASIDVSHLPAGIYTLIVQSDRKVYTKKIVKVSK